MPATPPASNRSTVRRKADRDRYDVDTIRAILDEALICHVGFEVTPACDACRGRRRRPLWAGAHPPP